LDKNGHIRYKHIGEGAYEETAHVIEYLMVEQDARHTKRETSSRQRRVLSGCFVPRD
jgi:hypothetical protein